MSIIFYVLPTEVEEYRRLYKTSPIRPNMKISYLVQEDPLFYPVNKLRNMAISQVQTTHFYLSDMDVWPSRPFCSFRSHLASTYRAIVNLPKSALEDNYLAIIVPAFQIYKGKCTTFEECTRMYALRHLCQLGTELSTRGRSRSCAPVWARRLVRPSVLESIFTTTTAATGSSPKAICWM